MPDRLTPAQRHKCMSRIRSKDTSIEIIMRKLLWKNGIRYRKYYPNIPGHPDIAITKYKIAIFCDSEFFHGYQWKKIRQKVAAGTHGDFWVKKIESNMARDELIDKQLYALGWTVLRFWGEEIKKKPEKCLKAVQEAIWEKFEEKAAWPHIAPMVSDF